MRHATLLSVVLLALCACTSPGNAPTSADTDAQAASKTQAVIAIAGDHAFAPAIRADDLAAHVKTLASDAFAGRGPGTAGEDRTIDYIRSQFARIGLQPGNGDSWVQTVPMLETTANPSASLRFAIGTTEQTLRYGDDMVVWTRSGRSHVSLADSPLVFVGYGVDAPDRDWNDYAGIDVKGKTVVMLINDPGFHTNDPRLFDGRRMTLYGRWTYKFEEAARHGAAAALIIHDDAGASYDWSVVRNSWSGPQHDLLPADDPGPRLTAQGWITQTSAEALFKAAGLDLATLRAAANRPGFTAVPLNAKAALELDSHTVRKTSRNVLGLLPGTSNADEAIVYMAHWDHLGTHAGEPGDNIYNGAVDNATGVAGILEIVEAFANAPQRPRRSILFLATTLEESGLLGSRYYVALPVFPLAQTVAAINLDALAPIGKAHDLAIVGKGSSQLDQLLVTALAAQGRRASEERDVTAGDYFRSDHFSFAQAGVPALYISSGDNLIDGGTAAGTAAQVDYSEHRYHQPGDQYDPASWNLDGIVEDLQALYSVGSTLANGDQWPDWSAGNPFKPLRDTMRPPPAAVGNTRPSLRPGSSTRPATPSKPAGAKP